MAGFAGRRHHARQGAWLQLFTPRWLLGHAAVLLGSRYFGLLMSRCF
ncbi:MAG: hypothetical protein U1D30_16415 [Planctomycetota bacterium]